MRRSLFLFAPLGLALFAFACEDDPLDNPTANLPEAGTFDADRPGFDSSAPEQDASPDAPVTPKGVTVIATGRSGPAANITVLFHDATGAVTETKKTGADGKATSVPTPTPAMATIVFGEGTSNRRLVTWTGVADGDELPAILPEDPNLGQVEITLAGQFDAGTYNYDSYIGRCYGYGSTGGDPWFISPYVGCVRGGGALLVEAQDVDQQNKIVGFSFKKPITIDPDGGTLQVTPGAWVAPVDIALTVSNTTNISGVGIFSQIGGGTVFTKRASLGDSYAATFQGAGPTFADAYNVSAAFPGTTSSTNERIIGRRIATNTTSVTLDANTLPPELTGTSLDETDKRRPIAKWMGTMTSMKGGIVRVFYGKYEGDSYSSTGWTLIVPATATEVKIPALPASLDAILPSPDAGQDSWDAVPRVAFADSTLLPDYGTFRKIQGVVLPSIDEDADLDEAVLPAAGDFKITSWHAQAE